MKIEIELPDFDTDKWAYDGYRLPKKGELFLGEDTRKGEWHPVKVNLGYFPRHVCIPKPKEVKPPIMIEYEGDEITLSKKAIKALKVYGREVAKAAAEADPDNAYCWTHCRVRFKYMTPVFSWGDSEVFTKQKGELLFKTGVKTKREPIK